MAPKVQTAYFRPGKLHFYCPLCGHHQTTSTIKTMNWRHHLQIALLTVAATTLTYPWIGLAGIALYPIFLAGFDFFYRLRKRQALVCESCGFDPFLYKKDVRKARAALKKHWEQRIAKENLFAGKKLRNYQTSAAVSPEQPAVESQLGAAQNAASAKPDQEVNPPANSP